MSSTDAANIRGQLRRADKVMSTAEIDHVLRTRFCGRTATVGSDGYPYVVPNLIYGTEALFGCTQERRTVTSRATQATMIACASKWTSREKYFLTVISSAIPRFRFVRSSFLDASASSGMRPRPGPFSRSLWTNTLLPTPGDGRGGRSRASRRPAFTGLRRNQ